MNKRGIKNKRGSHIDVILSFVIFVSFLILLYSLIQASVMGEQSKNSALDYLGNQIIQNLSSKNLTMISIYLSPQNSRPCLALTGFMANAGISSMRLVLKNSTGTTFPSYKSGNDLYIDMSQFQNSRLFYAYYSPDFNLISDNTLGTCNPALLVNPPNNPPNIYSISYEEPYTSSYVWGGDIISLINLTNNNYDSVKNGFNVAKTDNFRFDFIYQNNTKIGMANNLPSSGSIYSKTLPVVYISGKNLEAGQLIVSVW
ncbi:MAG TPA: hypothetical protein VMC07_01390 [Candidatus Omnitrophota bacterium]|nr:hypothetical protein [Candidatus Omnitrophota bacterium]